MNKTYGVLVAILTYFAVSNALVCWTCIDDDCLLPKVNWAYILCDQDYVNTSHHQISSIYGLEPSPPKNVKNFECVEIDTKLQFTNSSEKFASFKGCVENKFNISSFSPNSTIYLNEERNEFRTCDMEMCNKLEISRPIPPLTTPSTNTTTTPVVSTPAINNTTTPVVSTPASNITTPVVSTPPSPSTPIPPPALKCYICTDDECSKNSEGNYCSREEVDLTHAKLSKHFNQIIQAIQEIESYKCMSISSEIGERKMLYKGCIEAGFSPCDIEDSKEKRSHCYTCGGDLCNTASSLSAATVLILLVIFNLLK